MAIFFRVWKRSLISWKNVGDIYFVKFANHSLIYKKGIITVIEVCKSENVLRFFLVSIEKTYQTLDTEFYHIFKHFETP